MKLLTFRYQNQRMPGVLSEDMTRVIPVSAFGLPYPDMLSLIRSVTPEEMEGLRSRRAELAEKEGIGLALTEKCAPIPCPDQDVICLGINYMAHAEESARFKHEEFNGERPYAVYFSKRVSEAVADGGLIDSHSDIVDSLDYEAELAIVFSNALENAIHACMRLPEEQREIRCKVISYPNLMFEFSNPYTGTVRFDERGLPVSSRQGHGIGSHSIAAFCEKHGAAYQYTAENGQFTLRVIL